MTSDWRIPFNKATAVGDELAYIAEALSRGPISGDGRFTRRCHEILERELGVAKALLTTSCTHALEMAALLLDIGPGDGVVVPAFTFVSSVNPFILRGARPVFCDIRPDTLNLDEAHFGGFDYAADQGDRGGALRRRGLRDGLNHGHRSAP